MHPQTSQFGNVRRAFRDVTNSSNNINAEALPLKRSTNTNTIGFSHHSKKVEKNIHQKSKSQDSLNVRNENFDPSENNCVKKKVNLKESFAEKPYQYSAPADNIDERDIDDPLCATEYVQDMYAYFRSKENQISVRQVYMENQPHINERMRSILVDWLVEVHLKFKLVPETLYLTINLIDRYLEVREVSRPTLQLVGVTCLLIASKYEEIYPPELKDLIYICDRAYSKEEILEMEEVILKALNYEVTIPSAHCFLMRFLKAAHADKKIVQLSCYVLDGTLQSYRLLQYRPSQLAAAAILIARRCVGRHSWSPTLLHYALYTEEDVLPVARAVLAEKASASTELRAVNKKYSSSRYGGVAMTPIPSDF